MFALKDKNGSLVVRTLVDEPFIYTARFTAELGKRSLEEHRKEKLKIVKYTA